MNRKGKKSSQSQIGKEEQMGKVSGFIFTDKASNQCPWLRVVFKEEGMPKGHPAS
jgi:hypothetical protein